VALDRLLERNVILQVVAVILAVALWVTATAEQNPEDQHTFDAVPLGIRDAPEGLAVTGPPRPAKVNITVRCRRRVYEKLDSGSFEAFVSLAGGNEGDCDYPVEVVLPEDVELVEINPASASVTLAKVVEHQMPVDPVLVGNPAEDFVVIRVLCSPERVSVRPEPGRELDIDRVRTAPVDISGRTSGLAVIVPVQEPEGVFSVEPESVEVTVEIGAELTLEGIPVSARNVAPGIVSHLEPGAVDLVLRGTKTLLDRLEVETSAVEAWVDAGGLGPGSHVVPVAVDLPEWAQDAVIVHISSPPEVTLTLGP